MIEARPRSLTPEHLSSLAQTRKAVHQINNLLTIIRMNADFMEPMLVENNLSATELREIRAASERIRDVASKLVARQPKPQGHPNESFFARSRALGTLATHQTILVVEDDAVLRALARRILSGHGYRVLEAEDGAAALRVAAGEGAEIDLVLTDVVMPTLSGPGMVAELRDVNAELRVLFFSGYSDDELLLKGLDRGADVLLRKPFAGSELIAAVQQALLAPALHLTA